MSRHQSTIKTGSKINFVASDLTTKFENKINIFILSLAKISEMKKIIILTLLVCFTLTAKSQGYIFPNTIYGIEWYRNKIDSALNIPTIKDTANKQSRDTTNLIGIYKGKFYYYFGHKWNLAGGQGFFPYTKTFDNDSSVFWQISKDRSFRVGNPFNGGYGIIVYNRNDTAIDVDIASGGNDGNPKTTSIGLTRRYIDFQSSNITGSPTIRLDSLGLKYTTEPDTSKFINNSLATIGWVKFHIDSKKLITHLGNSLLKAQGDSTFVPFPTQINGSFDNSITDPIHTSIHINYDGLLTASTLRASGQGSHAGDIYSYTGSGYGSNSTIGFNGGGHFMATNQPGISSMSTNGPGAIIYTTNNYDHAKFGNTGDSLTIQKDATIHQYHNGVQVFNTDVNGHAYDNGVQLSTGSTWPTDSSHYSSKSYAQSTIHDSISYLTPVRGLTCIGNISLTNKNTEYNDLTLSSNLAFTVASSPITGSMAAIYITPAGHTPTFTGMYLSSGSWSTSLPNLVIFWYRYGKTFFSISQPAIQ